MKKFNYKEIKQLFLQVGSKSWADSCMSGRCGVSKKRLQLLQQLASDIPIEFLYTYVLTSLTLVTFQVIVVIVTRSFL